MECVVQLRPFTRTEALHTRISLGAHVRRVPPKLVQRWFMESRAYKKAIHAAQLPTHIGWAGTSIMLCQILEVDEVCLHVYFKLDYENHDRFPGMAT